MDNSSLDVLFSISFTNKEFENNRIIPIHARHPKYGTQIILDRNLRL